MDSIAPVPDTCLLFGGEPLVSEGLYRQSRYELRLRGADKTQHHVTHLHEIHHKVLDDDTAWGSMMRIAAHHREWQESVLPWLVSSSRLVHEAVASFMSVSLAQHHAPGAGRVLTDYPAYLPLLQQMQTLLAPVSPGHRQELAATGIARFCMGAPVIEKAVEVFPRPLPETEIPSSWLPNQRYDLILDASEQDARTACDTADAAFADATGCDVDELALESTDAALDLAWRLWEDAFIAQLIAADPRPSACDTVGPDGHLEAASALLSLAGITGISIEAPADADAAPLSDPEQTQRLLTATTIRLRDHPWASALSTVGDGVDGEAVIALSAAGTPPFLVIHGRTPHQLGAAFAFDAASDRWLATQTSPVFAARVLIDDDSDEGMILHATLDEPNDYERFIQRWPAGYPLANCITASCFTDTRWQDRWAKTLATAPTVVLADIGMLGAVGEGRLIDASGPVHAIHLGVNNPSLRAMAWHVHAHPHIMLALADDLGIQLLSGQLAELLGERLILHDSDWSEWHDVLAAVLGSLLGTEYTLGFAGLTPIPGRIE